MYRNSDDGQFTIYDFILPFGGHLNKDNRWVKLREKIRWDIIDEEYSKNFENKGSIAKLVGFRIPNIVPPAHVE